MDCIEKAFFDFTNCRLDCEDDPVPPDFAYMPAWLYRKLICYPKCLETYTLDLANCEAAAVEKAVTDAFIHLGQALEPVLAWLQANPIVAIGGVIVVGGVVLIVTGGVAAPEVIGFVFLVAG